MSVRLRGSRVAGGGRASAGRRAGLRAGSLSEFDRLEDRRLMTAATVPSSYGVIENTPLVVAETGVLAADQIASGNPLRIASVTQPSHGTLAMNPDGTFRYTPNAGFSGSDSFGYVAADGAGHSAAGTTSLVVAACDPTACVTAGPRLASLDSTQGPVLDAILGGLLGTSVDLTAVDSNAIAQGRIDGLDLLQQLQATLGVASPSQALTAQATVGQILTAAASAARTEGDLADATALGDLLAQVGNVPGTVRLGDLLDATMGGADLAETRLNALDLVSGTAQLFNAENVATTPTPVTIDGSAIGLGGLVGTAQVYAQAVEPPVEVCGPVGSQFESAEIRLQINLNLANTTLDASTLAGNLRQALAGVAGVTATATLGQVQLYVDVARGSGTISAIDAVSHAVTVQATPGVADVYLGDIPQTLFFDRTHVIDAATDVGYGNVGTLAVGLTNPATGAPIAAESAAIQARAVAEGTAPTPSTLTFTPPYPQTRSSATSAAFVTNLANQLATSLDVRIGGTLGPILDPLVNTTILPVVRPLVTGVVTPVLAPVLTGAVDPLLADLGVGIGELGVTVESTGLCPPIANGDLASTPEGTPATIPVLGDDAIAMGDTLSIASTTPPAHGTVTIGANGSVVYTPTPGYSGFDTFRYTITDPAGNTSTATVGVQVTPPPAPSAVDDAYSTPSGSTLVVPAPGVLGNDSDPAGRPLTPTIVSPPAHGTAVLTPSGGLVYTPTPGFTGTDTLTYRDADGTSTSNLATVLLTVTPAGSGGGGGGGIGTGGGSSGGAGPIANDDAYRTPVGTPLVVGAPGVQSNDVDLSGLPLTSTILTQPAHGTVTLGPGGGLTYVPNAGFTGVDSFTYDDSDGAATSGPATVFVAVGTAAVGAGAPVANDDSYSTAAGTPLVVAASGVLANDTSPAGTMSTPVVVAGPSHGTVALAGDGSLVYIPAAGYSGPDSFTYRDVDGLTTSGPATVSIAVAAGPQTVPDTYAVTAGTPLVVAGPGVLANDVAPTGQSLTAVVVAGPSNGTLQLGPDGSLIYVPNAGFSGTDTFRYRAVDSNASGAPATVTVNVAPAATGVACPCLTAAPEVLHLERFGYHLQSTYFVLVFDRPLDPATASNAANYAVYGPGRDDIIGTTDDRIIPIASATYVASADSVVLAFNQRLILRSNYEVVANGSAIRGADGTPIDGGGQGVAGSNFVGRVDRTSVFGTAGQVPGGPLAIQPAAASTRPKATPARAAHVAPAKVAHVATARPAKGMAHATRR